MSLCVGEKSKRESIELSIQLIEQILKKEEDQFGLFGFNFMEMKSCSLICMMNCSIIRANLEMIFSHIYETFLLQEFQSKKEED